MRTPNFTRIALTAVLMALGMVPSSALANDCDRSDPTNGVTGGNYCIAVETVTTNPGAPLVVVLHGDMSSGKPPSYATRFAKRITERNPDITIVSMLRPGYDNGDGKKSQGSTNGRRDHYTGVNVDAVGDAIRNLAAHHKAPRTIVVGHSGGAATAALIAGRQPEVLDGMVLISCPCDITRWRLERNGSAWPSSLSPSDYVDQVRPDLQITAVTGRNDDNTQPGLAKSYVAEIRERGGIANFLEIPGERHFLSTKLADQVLPMISEMVDSPRRSR
ncbi:MAG: alpha/beta hydrolase [Alphaproteobacteria bacterium]